tara:strand:- start:2475 stop:2714 length:240 start_codon:yes stop_codon:yes gene_type:complete
MGASKDLFMEVRLRAEMSEETFTQIPEHLRDEMKIKSIEAANFKEVYKKDKAWSLLQKEMIKALEARAQREAQIRVESR